MIVMTNEYMKEKFQMVVESKHVDNDTGKIENVGALFHD